MAYTNRIPLPRLDVHAVDRYLWLGPLLGLDNGPPNMDIPVHPGSEARIEELLSREMTTGKPVAVLVPGTQWQTKHWHVEGFAEVARHLMRTGRAVVLENAGGSDSR